MTYEENLRKTAEEMAKEDRDTSGARAYIKYINAARYCLKKQAEAYREGFISGFSGGYDSMLDAKERVTVKLKTLGLIP